MIGDLSTEETAHLLRTIEMFEAIARSREDDCQSLEILKESYDKLRRPADSLRVSVRLAQAYAKFGQIPRAIVEYEGLLREYPDDLSIRASLAALRQQVVSSGVIPHPPAPLLAKESKQPVLSGALTDASFFSVPIPADDQEGNRVLADLLITEKLITKQAVQPLLQRLKTDSALFAQKGDPLTLIQLLADEQIVKLEDLLVKLVERSGLPYLPLSIYDADRDAVCALPQEFCFSHCLVPFDLLSRSVLVATANPFDALCREEAQRLLNCSVFWFVAAPAEIIATLRRVHRTDAKTNANVPTGATA